jgi:hypothetical protein
MANKQLRKRPSLLLADQQAGQSIEEAYEAALAKLEAEPVKEFSAEWLYRKKPQIYALIVKMLAEGLSMRAISRACGVSQHSLEAIKLREGYSIEAERQKLLQLTRLASRVSIERLIELMPEMSPRDLAIAYGITVEKAQLLAGEPTSITLTQEDTIRHADFNALLACIPSANAKVIETNAEVGR